MLPRRQIKRHEMTGLSASVAEEKTMSCWKFTWPVEKWEKQENIGSDILINTWTHCENIQFTEVT